MSKTCERCGSPVQLIDKFCLNCGAQIIFESPEKNRITRCPKCEYENSKDSAFCEKCGASLAASESSKNQKAGPQTFSSTGNYSGKMIKGKTSKGWRIFRTILIVLVLLGIIALVIWFQVDPDAGKKLTDVTMGIGFMLVFFFFGWLFMRGRKGKKSDWDDDQYADVDNDYDSDDDD